MFFMIAFTNGKKDLNHSQTVICDVCGRYGAYEVFMTYTQLILFFIPVFRWNRRYYVRMRCCGTLYGLDPNVGAEIAKGLDVEIRTSDLTRLDGYEDGSYEYHQGGAGWKALADDGQEDADSTARKALHGDPAEPVRIHHRCVICGYETDEDFKYCPKCGQRF